MSPLEAAIEAYNAAKERLRVANVERDRLAAECREAERKMRFERLKVAQQRNKQ